LLDEIRARTPDDTRRRHRGRTMAHRLVQRHASIRSSPASTHGEVGGRCPGPARRRPTAQLQHRDQQQNGEAEQLVDEGPPWRSSPSAYPRGRCRTAGWRQAANRGYVSRSAIPSAGGCRIKLLSVSGGAIRRDRCGGGALHPMVQASAPRAGRQSTGPRDRSRPRAGRRPP
jgi:hypothetical protein